MPQRFLEVRIEVKIRQVITVLEEQNLDLMLVDPALEAMALPVLEGILVDVASRADYTADSVLVARMDVPHALALSVEFVFPRLERGHFSISHLLHGLDYIPVKLE